MDFYGFYTGKVFDAYKYLGAHVTGRRRDIPHLRSVRVEDLSHRRI